MSPMEDPIYRLLFEGREKLITAHEEMMANIELIVQSLKEEHEHVKDEFDKRIHARAVYLTQLD